MIKPTLLSSTLIFSTSLMMFACSSITTKQDRANQDVLPQPATLTTANNYQTTYTVSGSTLKRITIEANVIKDYANLSIVSGDRVLADNLDLPTKGQQSLNVLVDFKQQGQHQLEFIGRSSEIQLTKVKIEDAEELVIPQFFDNSAAANFNTETTFKYGGPSIGDIDNDGDLDFVLNNHNHVPTQLVTNLGNGKVDVKRLFGGKPDLHGSALGDYDNDGDLDIIVAHGGSNGTNPISYTLFNNNNMVFEKVTKQAGITTPARGRAPRWSDLDNDGDLDLILFNAKRPFYKGAQTLFLENLGNSKFKERQVGDIQSLDGSKALVFDYNRDGLDDILMYYPAALTLWQNNGDFSFTNLTTSHLPKEIQKLKNINAATDIDVNNDGLIDIYLANGRSHYSISRKSIDFSPQLKKLDINDDGEKGRTLIEFTAEGDITLSKAKFVFRQYRKGFPIYLGKNKTLTYVQPHDYHKNDNRYPKAMEAAPHDVTFSPDQAMGWPETRAENGIYLGYLGDNKWQAEWVRNQTIYWAIEFSITGLNDVSYDWQANNRNVQDVLLLNKGTHFEDASQAWNLPLGGNHWGVSRGDFNNDGFSDLFVHRYGYLKERVADLMLLNNQGSQFELVTSHGAMDPNDPGHGDMGQVFDFNQDGKLDMLNGSEDRGKWYLYLNDSQSVGNYIQFKVGYSPVHNVDPLSAEVVVKTESGKEYVQTVGSTGEAHSQSVINFVHFGLGSDSKVISATITWRNGEQQQLKNLAVNKLHHSNN